MLLTRNRVFYLVCLELLNISLVWSACIFLSDCPVALKYIQKRRYDPETLRVLRNAHCGLGNRGAVQEAKVFCERIADFSDVPEGCIRLNDCPEAQELIRTRRYDPEVIRLLRSSACGYNNNKNMIICNNIKLKASDNNKLNLLPKPNECGIQDPISKITGGQRADLEDFPWLALFKYKNATGHVAYRCHGSLISKRYVVSAAHCLSLSSADKRKVGSLTTVVLGEYDVTRDEDCLFPQYGGSCADPVQEFGPEEIHIHPSFGSGGALSDIALIRLNKDVTFSDYVRPICLPINGLLMKPRENLLIGGWGKNEQRLMSTIKLKARINLLSKSDCAHYNIDNTQICAGSTTGADTCKGDSGGPLMALRQSQNHETVTYLAGVVSFGDRCGSGAAIYTNVTLFVEWILDNMH